MEWSFQKITLFPRGTLAALLRDAYSFDSRWEVAYGGSWREFDAFFFDHPEIADRYGFFSVLDGVPIGFVSWDPRRLPESVEIGHNCIRSDWKGRGIRNAADAGGTPPHLRCPAPESFRRHQRPASPGAEDVRTGRFPGVRPGTGCRIPRRPHPLRIFSRPVTAGPPSTSPGKTR